MNDENFKISKKNKPRIFANNLTSNKEKNIFVKVFLLYVITEKMISALLGQFNHQKCFMIIKRKRYIMIMQ